MITATGKLVEVETNDKGYRTAFVLDGRAVEPFSVGKRINGELDALLNQEVVVTLRRSTRWFDTSEGGRRPSDSLIIIDVRAAEPIAA